MWVLIWIVIYGGHGVATGSAEFNGSATCSAAQQELMDANPTREMFVACYPKG